MYKLFKNGKYVGMVEEDQKLGFLKNCKNYGYKVEEEQNDYLKLSNGKITYIYKEIKY